LEVGLNKYIKTTSKTKIDRRISTIIYDIFFGSGIPTLL